MLLGPNSNSGILTWHSVVPEQGVWPQFYGYSRKEAHVKGPSMMKGWHMY